MPSTTTTTTMMQAIPVCRHQLSVQTTAQVVAHRLLAVRLVALNSKRASKHRHRPKQPSALTTKRSSTMATNPSIVRNRFLRKQSNRRIRTNRVCSLIVIRMVVLCFPVTEAEVNVLPLKAEIRYQFIRIRFDLWLGPVQQHRQAVTVS